MFSDDSDDEPLSVIANKKFDPEQHEESTSDSSESQNKKKRKLPPPKRLSITIKLQRPKPAEPPPVKERPEDVWLYLKDLNPSGPYSCLLCPDWFINRSKIILHYVINHKKDFCGVCRYFVPDREAWAKHLKFHTPWPCSQCVENFETEGELRNHLKSRHNLVHCRLCHFRVLDGELYHSHLFQKHNVSNVTNKDEDNLWELEYDGTSNFLCLLCNKSTNSTRTFFNHYMGYHHFTLKCFAALLSGRDIPFSVYGADLRAEFVEEQLKHHARYGYVDSEFRPSDCVVVDDPNQTRDLLKVLIPEIKQEIETPDETNNDDGTAKAKDDDDDIYKSYNGIDDFDVTLMELIIVQKCYHDYISDVLSDINANSFFEYSDLDYEHLTTEVAMDIVCTLCSIRYSTLSNFASHMFKMHSIKSLPVFSCRVCATTFDTQNELENHISNELGEFEDLWLCQFCDKEFDDRENTRRHMTEHWEHAEYDNCFSPHIGFKCRYCPTLFWHETDRETHQVRAHFFNHKDAFYKCETCNEIFSDKVWYVHHHLEKHSTPEKTLLYLLKCSLCCVVMPSIEEMRGHFNCEHPEARKVFCSLDACQYKPLCHRKSFKLHVRTMHSSRGSRPEPSVECVVCGREFGSSRACGAHMAQAHGPGKFKCKLCREGGAAHYGREVSLPEPAVECVVCGREFGSSRACGAHMAQAHGPGKFKCKLCREVLHTMDERKLHYLISHPGQHPFDCSECGKSFQYKSSLYMHKQEHLPNKQNYTCTFCGKTFLKRDSFREHVQIHEGPRHACSYCPMRFVQRSNMLRHERRHTGERPYACPHCPRNFADKGACNSHARTHLKDTSYACMYCGKTFVQKSKLTYHIRKHTGENLETCTVCSKLFTSACSLREHMKIHEPKKELVKCPLCDRKYQDERYMLRHLRTSHTHARHPCPICDKTLTSPAGLRHHVMTHSNMKTIRVST
ncbi:hypothetical protein PYW07_004344 [Mythimna separata]|uniref:C2H2-type domain-containing protein n=1 Tax=Mythimna separata TaxID=271217 RepID=A0AAD7YVL1_MYTSE|nr:hypothetical protein PYW07_004344 [Mythimna separata]